MVNENIKEVLKEHPEGLSISEIVKQTGLAKDKIIEELDKLEKEGIIGSKETTASKEISVEKSKEIEKKLPAKIDIAKIKWTLNMGVDNETIDSQHKKLLNQIHKLVEELSFGNELQSIRSTIKFLEDYIKEHIIYEEKYMKQNNYPGFSQHKKIHDNFIDFFNSFKEEFELDYKLKVFSSKSLKELGIKSQKFLGEWWINHILKEDQKYADYIRENIKISKKPVEKKIISKKVIKPKIDVSKIAAEIKQEQILKQRAPIKNLEYVSEGSPKDNSGEPKPKVAKGNFVMTGIAGFDELLDQGIPKGNSILVAGGAGSGKTIFCLQTLAHHASKGKKCLYMSFEEREEKLIKHMENFNWNPKELIEKGNLRVQRINPFDITRNVDALLAKQKGELLIDVDPVIIPTDFKPDFIVLDSLTAIASAFTGKEENYRIYIEQLFRFFEKIGATSFLVTETEQIPKIFSKTGVEEFLADGVVVLYNLKHGNVRENAIEILKLRGAKHQKKIVAMQITGAGVVVYPEQEVFSEISNDLQ